MQPHGVPFFSICRFRRWSRGRGLLVGLPSASLSRNLSRHRHDGLRLHRRRGRCAMGKRHQWQRRPDAASSRSSCSVGPSAATARLLLPLSAGHLSWSSPPQHHRGRSTGRSFMAIRDPRPPREAWASNRRLQGRAFALSAPPSRGSRGLSMRTRCLSSAGNVHAAVSLEFVIIITHWRAGEPATAPCSARSSW